MRTCTVLEVYNKFHTGKQTKGSMIIYVIDVVDKIMMMIRWQSHSKVSSRLMEEKCIHLISHI